MEKITEYKATEIQKDIYDTKELRLEDISKKINEIVEWINDHKEPQLKSY